MIRSLLSMTHFCARRRMRSRPSWPSASHAGWAARARATISRTSSADRLGTDAMISPVAGFSTGMSLPLASAWSTRSSMVAIGPSCHSITSGDGGYRGGEVRPARRRAPRLAQLDALDLRRVERAVARVGLHGLDRVEDVHAAGDTAEHGVLAVEPRRLGHGDQEELRAVGVRAGVGHGERAPDDLVVVELVLEGVAGAAGPRPVGIAPLDHEVVDDAMEDHAVVEAVGRELAEVLDGLG